jgi:hypothetical protein
MLSGEPQDVVIETMQRASRSNGSINVSRFVDMATMVYVRRRYGAPDD